MTQSRRPSPQTARFCRHPVPALLFALALVVNLAIPPGFMPSNHDGQPTVVLCPDDGRSARLLERLGQTHHHDHSHETRTATPLCELALLAGFELALPTGEWNPLPALHHRYSSTAKTDSPRLPFPRNGLARAPPGRLRFV